MISCTIFSDSKVNLQDQHRVVSIRRTEVHHEVRQLDLRRTVSGAEPWEDRQIWVCREWGMATYWCVLRKHGLRSSHYFVKIVCCCKLIGNSVVHRSEYLFSAFLAAGGAENIIFQAFDSLTICQCHFARLMQLKKSWQECPSILVVHRVHPTSSFLIHLHAMVSWGISLFSLVSFRTAISVLHSFNHKVRLL